MGAGAVGSNAVGVHVPSERYLITCGGDPRKIQKAIR